MDSSCHGNLMSAIVIFIIANRRSGINSNGIVTNKSRAFMVASRHIRVHRSIKRSIRVGSGSVTHI